MKHHSVQRLVVNCAVVLLAITVGPALAQDEQPHCVWYDVCGRNDYGMGLNCPYDGPGIALQDADAQQQLLHLCPDIYKSSECIRIWVTFGGKFVSMKCWLS